MERFFSRSDLTIANNGTTSDAVQSVGYAAFGLVMPAAFTGTTISFLVSADGVTYQALYDRYNVLVSMTVAVSRSYDLPVELAGWHSFKIVSGSSEGAARTLGMTCKS